MGHRTVVRQGSVVSLSLLVVALALPALSADKGQTKPSATAKAKTKAPAPIPIDRRPYAIRVWFSIDPASRIDAKAREVLLGSWRALFKRFVGAPWSVDIADDEGPFEAGDLEGLTFDAIKPLVKDRDKGWFIRVSPSGSGLAFSGREFDNTTSLLGPVCRREAVAVADSPRALFLLSLDIFSPLAEIGSSSAGGVSISVQAASLEAADPIGRVVAPGSIFRPLRIVIDPKTKAPAVKFIQSTYLRVEKNDGSASRCQIISGLSDPFTRMIAAKNRVVAVGVKPSATPTRLRFLVGKEKTPAAGYTLTARNVPDSPPHEVGLTDREGRIVLEPGYANGLVVFKLLAGGVEPLVEFPYMPGEGERIMNLPDVKPYTVALETKLNALRDEIVDQVAIRGRIEVKLKPRGEAGAWDEVKLLLTQYRALPTRTSFDERLAAMKAEAESQQSTLHTAVLTANAQHQLNEVQALMDRYLDDAVFTAYDDAMKQALEEPAKAQAKTKGQAKTAAKPQAKPQSKTASSPPAQAATPPPAQGVAPGAAASKSQAPSKPTTKPPVSGSPF
jgi:hypothetical protein